jgi:hypothetical protein
MDAPEVNMTKTQAIQAIRALGMAVRPTGFGSELRVSYKMPDLSEDSRLRAEASAYYTDDPQDAVDTATRMAEAHNA